uniref:Uncharacterized protein n=1 Tax=Oryza meridionalis TaxID=40149 RepID=A0A0E0CSP2_9ORYZ
MRERVEFLHSLERVEFLHFLSLSARRDDRGDISPRRPRLIPLPLLRRPRAAPAPAARDSSPTGRGSSPAAPAPASAPLGLVGSGGVIFHRRCPPHEGLGR